jgi:predicted nucleic acid-binding protein
LPTGLFKSNRPAAGCSTVAGSFTAGGRTKAWSLTDCISFVVMRDLKLTEALTGDQHFEQAGFLAILK